MCMVVAFAPVFMHDVFLHLTDSEVSYAHKRMFLKEARFS